jgi:hypothetical protein
MALSKALIAKLKKKYKRPLGTRVGDSRKIMQQLTKGASMPTYMAKDGGYVAKKGKKIVKKRKTTKKK